MYPGSMRAYTSSTWLPFADFTRTGTIESTFSSSLAQIWPHDSTGAPCVAPEDFSLSLTFLSWLLMCRTLGWDSLNTVQVRRFLQSLLMWLEQRQPKHVPLVFKKFNLSLVCCLHELFAQLQCVLATAERTEGFQLLFF